MGLSCIFKMAGSSAFQGLKEIFCYLELPSPCFGSEFSFWTSEGLMPVALTGFRYSLAVQVLPAVLCMDDAPHWQLLMGAGAGFGWPCSPLALLSQEQLDHAWTHPLACWGAPVLYPEAKWAPQLHKKTPLQMFLLKSSPVYGCRIRTVPSQEGCALPQHWKGNPLSSNRPFSSPCVHLTDLVELPSPFFVRKSLTITDNGNCAHLNPCLC